MFQPNQHRTHGLGYETPGRVFVQRIRIDRVRNEPRSILFLMLFYWPCNEHQLPLHVPFVRAHSKITSHFKRRCILAGCVTKARNMLDCAAFVPCQTGASTLKLANLFLSYLNSSRIGQWSEPVTSFKIPAPVTRESLPGSTQK